MAAAGDDEEEQSAAPKGKKTKSSKRVETVAEAPSSVAPAPSAAQVEVVADDGQDSQPGVNTSMDGGVVDDSKDADEQDLVPSHAKKDVKGKGKAVEPITMATETAKNAHDSDEMARLKAELAFKESVSVARGRNCCWS